MNKVFLIGNLTREPELSETNSGVAFCRFSIAVNNGYGENKKTDFFNIIAWRNQAENCGRFLKKGSKVAIEGSLQNRSYEDKDGNKRTITEIIANEVELLSTKETEEESKQAKLTPADDEEGLPFWCQTKLNNLLLHK